MAALEFSLTTLLTDPNLVAYWKLENVNSYDSDSAKLLSNAGTVTFTAAKFNNGANFGTSHAHSKALQLTTGLTTNLSNAFAVSLWLNVTTALTTGTPTIFDWRSTTGTARYAILQYDYNSGTKRLVIDNSGSNNVNYNVDLGTATWFHIVFQKQSDGKMHLYLNGGEVGTAQTQGTASAGNELGIGNYGDPGATNGIAALIDDVALFSRELTLGEISMLANGSTPLFAENVPSASFVFSNKVVGY